MFDNRNAGRFYDVCQTQWRQWAWDSGGTASSGAHSPLWEPVHPEHMEDEGMVEKRRKSFVKRMVIALVLGVIVGAVVALLKPSMGEGVWNVLNTIFFQDISVSEGRSAIGLFYIIQTVFTNALKLAIVPMVLFSIIMSVCGMNDMRKLGRIAAKTILMCFVC